MLTETAIREILESKENLTEYVTASMVQAISLGIDKIKSPDASPSATASLIEALRKARADLTGDAAQSNMPQMVVSIQFSGQDQQAQINAHPVGRTIEGETPSVLRELENIGEQSDN